MNIITRKVIFKICLLDGSAVYLALPGKLVQEGQEIGPEEYCLAENWEHAGSGGHAGEELKDFLGPVALSCDQCMEEVCLYKS